MKMNRIYEAMIAEIGGVLSRIDDTSIEKFVQTVYAAPRIFVAGCGRSGLMARAFAMRAMHLGKTVHVLGDVTTPSIHENDVLVIASGSGETHSLVSHAKKAKQFGAKVALITIYPDSTIGGMADSTVHINAPTAKSEKETGITSVQPMGSLFEQSLLLFLDGAIVRMMEIAGKDSAGMFENHANLE